MDLFSKEEEVSQNRESYVSYSDNSSLVTGPPQVQEVDDKESRFGGYDQQSEKNDSIMLESPPIKKRVVEEAKR